VPFMAWNLDLLLMAAARERFLDCAGRRVHRK
jgi:hypothetical protein